VDISGAVAFYNEFLRREERSIRVPSALHYRGGAFPTARAIDPQLPVDKAYPVHVQRHERQRLNSEMICFGRAMGHAPLATWPRSSRTVELAIRILRAISFGSQCEGSWPLKIGKDFYPTAEQAEADVKQLCKSEAQSKRNPANPKEAQPRN